MAKKKMKNGMFIRIEHALNRMKPNPWPKVHYWSIDSRTCELECPEMGEEELDVFIAELLIL